MKRATPLPLLVALLASMAVCSCGPAEVLALDNELNELLQNVQAERTNPTGVPAVSDKLADLSQRAEKAALTSKDPANAAALYRIAATAAWTAGPPHNTALQPLSDKGTEACGKLPNEAARHSRDCELLKVAPLLGALDDQQTQIRKLRGTERTIPTEKLTDAARVMQDVAALTKQLLAARTTFGPEAKPFDDLLQSRLTDQFCTLQRFVGQIDESMPPEALMAGVTRAAQDAQAALTSASVSTACRAVT